MAQTALDNGAADGGGAFGPAADGGVGTPPRDSYSRFRAWAARVGLDRKLAYGLTAAATISGLGTYGAVAHAGPDGPDPQFVLGLLYLNLLLLLLLGAVVSRRLARIWMERRQGLAGSRLHGRLVFLFALVALLPTILVSGFSILAFDFGVRSWFSERVATAVNGSLAIAEAYLEEHRQTIRGDALAMANDLNREAAALVNNPGRFARVVTTQAALRNLPEAVVFDSSGRALARTGLSLTFEFEAVPDAALRRVRDGEVAIVTTANDDRIRALVRLDRFVDGYLFVGRFVDPGILSQFDQTSRAVHQYKALEGRRFDFQLTFALIFAVVALLLLFAAIFFGLNLATRLTGPVRALIAAAEKVSAGDLDARVPGGLAADELGTLSRTFNRMTRQLSVQREELIDANRQIDARRVFTETVLRGVSAGVIGLDMEGRVTLANRSAAGLLGIDAADLTGHRLSDLLPEVDILLSRAAAEADGRSEAQIEIDRDHGWATLRVRVSVERVAGEVSGHVVTFDDITELLSAQRKAAWADVARRIAHEMKNPLTPIQLATERLKLRYSGRIDDTSGVFEACTDTIVRQVGDIGRMVDEFSAFARMPAPVFASHDMAGLIRDQAALQQAAHPGIRFAIADGGEGLMLVCDAGQVRRALTNLLQNAVQAIAAGGGSDDGETAAAGTVGIRVCEDAAHLILEIADDGCGLPAHDRGRLTEPYVTTRPKGTGLGLAIVKRIMEDHHGSLSLRDRPGGGTVAQLAFPRASGPESGSGAASEPGTGGE